MDDFRNKKVNYGMPEYKPLAETQPIRRNTMTYSYVDEARNKSFNSETASAKLAEIGPTEMMPAVTPVVINKEVTTIRTIVTQLIEFNIKAWTDLPREVRDTMLSNPSAFTIIHSKSSDAPDISYNGVELRWNGVDSWVLLAIRSV